MNSAKSNIQRHPSNHTIDKLSLEEIVDKLNNNRLPNKLFDTGLFSIDGDNDNSEKVLLRDHLNDKSKNILLNRKNISYNEDNNMWDNEWAVIYAATVIADMKGYNYEELFGGKVLRAMLLRDILKGYFSSLNGVNTYEIGGGSGYTLIKMLEQGAIVRNYDQSEIALDYFKYLSGQNKRKSKAIRGTFQEIPAKIKDGSSMITFNTGVFEHIEEEERQFLMSEMVRITAYNGIVLVAVPNMDGPHYVKMRKRETDFHEWTGYSSPMEINRRFDLRKLMETNGLRVIAEDGLLIAPSIPVTVECFKRVNSFFTDKDIELYSMLPGTEKIPDRIKSYMLLEKASTSDTRRRLGQFVYAVGQKTRD